MSLKQHIPNLFTISNLICGSLSVVNLLEGGNPAWSGWLIFLAAFFDLLDGAIARALGVSGELGKQLDSLADVVSFGLAPSVIAYHFLSNNLSADLSFLKYITFINVAAAAIRLARFNISTDQKNDFSGMPSPANGLLWAAIIVAYQWMMERVLLHTSLDDTQQMAFLILFLVALSSWLMIAPVRMFSFKFKPGGFAQNKIPFLFIALLVVIAIVFLVVFQSIIPAIPICILVYILLSFLYHFQQKRA